MLINVGIPPDKRENPALQRPIYPGEPGVPRNRKRACSPPKNALGQVSKAAPADPALGAAGERYDAYAGSLFPIPGTKLRVVASADGLCWILQRREGRDHWVGWKFFSNKRRLAAVLKELLPADAFRTIEAKIHSLPI